MDWNKKNLAAGKKPDATKFRKKLLIKNFRMLILLRLLVVFTCQAFDLGLFDCLVMHSRGHHGNPDFNHTELYKADDPKAEIDNLWMTPAVWLEAL